MNLSLNLEERLGNSVYTLYINELHISIHYR